MIHLSVSLVGFYIKFLRHSTEISLFCWLAAWIMNLEGRIPFDNTLCYWTRAPAFHKAFPVLPMAIEGLRQRQLLGSQAESRESGKVSSAEGVHIFLFREGYFLQRHFQMHLNREEKSQVFATPSRGYLSLLVSQLVCSQLQAVPNSISQCPVCDDQGWSREKIKT